MKLLSLFFMIVFSLSSFAQNRMLSVVHLKSGNKLRGDILQKTKDSIHVYSVHNNLLLVAIHEVDSITHTSRREVIRTYKTLIAPEKRWFTLAEVNTRPNYLDELSIGASIYRGYKFNSVISLAAGIGILNKPSVTYDYQNHYRLALQSRFDMPRKGDFPFLLLEGGLQRVFSEPKMVLPFYYQAGLGYCFKTLNGRSVLLSAGVTQSMIRYKTYEFIGFGKPRGPAYYSDWYYHYEPFLKVALRF